MKRYLGCKHCIVVKFLERQSLLHKTILQLQENGKSVFKIVIKLSQC